MAGLYIHIPFCKSRCIYCGFYSTTNSEKRSRYADFFCREMLLRKDYLNEPISTIYLGGGTPSQLSPRDTERIFSTISNIFTIESSNGQTPEITMECNPDDITENFCQNLKTLPVNRVSMGVQTFSDSRLHFLRRRHTAAQIPIAVERLRKAGIQNISIDLMFGFPEETLQQWTADIEMALSLGVEHISAYSLMYEEGTPLYSMLERNEVKEIDEEVSLQMYEALTDILTAADYEHYEISNFAKPGFRSRHNSSYWQSVPYLGIGAAAHSFNGNSRQWNVSDINEYMQCIECGRIPAEIEELTDDMRFDDIVMTRLRTIEGISISEINRTFGSEYTDYILRESQKHIDAGLLKLDTATNHLHLTRKGLYVSDTVMSDLMHV